jgi:apolipoprotein D and lipocalin family protein
MTTTTLPLPPVTDPAAGLDLDARIALAEAHLTARQERLRTGVHAISQGVQGRWRPLRATLPVLGGALALGILSGLWWWRRRPPRPAVSPPPVPSGDAGGVPWVRFVTLAWPLLPARWRAHVSPATASAVAGFGLPLVERLMRRPPALPALPTVEHVDLARYAGDWYEVARLPAPFESACTGQPTAHYTLDGGGLQVLNQCPADGVVRASRGHARVAAGSDGARLEVSFWPAWMHWLPGTWSDYWILHLDDDYTEALVGTPGREFLWLLSRRPTLPAERVEAMVQFARGVGFAVERLQFSSVPAARD